MAGRLLLSLLALLGGVLLHAESATAGAQVKGPVRLTLEVPPGQVKTFRLRNLPQDAAVAVQVQTNGEVQVAFLDAADFKRFPQTARPLFTGRVEKQILFSLRMPETGDYYVLLDNRLGQEPRKVTVTIRAARGHPDQLSLPPTDEGTEEGTLRDLSYSRARSFRAFPCRCPHPQAGDPRLWAPPMGHLESSPPTPQVSLPGSGKASRRKLRGDPKLRLSTLDRNHGDVFSMSRREGERQFMLLQPV